jgi:hypothetical protein
MTRTINAATLWLMLASTLAPAAVFAQSAPRRGWEPDAYVAVGSRVVGRFGAYHLGGLGGQITVRPARWVSLELFTDHMVGTRDGALRHDHEVGATVRFHLLRGPRWTVFPLLGACANLAVLHAAQAPSASFNDIQFGLRAGVGAEYALPHGFSVGVDALALGYLGHAIEAWDRRVELAPSLSLLGAGQVVVHASWYL